MEYDKIEGYVDTLLESWAVFDEGDEREVYDVMRHALMAWAHYELMTDAHRALVTALMKKVQIYFDTKCMLKERKRKKRNREESVSLCLRRKRGFSTGMPGLYRPV